MLNVRSARLHFFVCSRWSLVAVLAGALAIAYFFCLPQPLFSDPYSTVLEDQNHRLLSASIAADGQWRFPLVDTVPAKFEQALVMFEDQRFHTHVGVDGRALARALRQNIRAGKIVSGGSTLSMQVIRLVRKDKPRTVWNKVIEMVMATRLEWRYSKKEIVQLYASHAPFGGNVVGLEAACWRYFGRDPSQLSWAEAATLAILPNNPGMIHLGRNRAALQQKRNRLLMRLARAGYLDSLALPLALQEAVPGPPLPLPRHAPHLLDHITAKGWKGQRVTSTLDEQLQQRVTERVWQHHQRLAANRIFNAAALVMEVETGHVVAYVGNVPSGERNQQQVDVIQAPRSTGSILKPFLFAALVDEGKLLPGMLLPDVPTVIQGFAPQNFSKSFDGAVPARDALIRSLNIPAVLALKEYRYEKFHSLLTQMGMTTLTRPPDHYGLTLITGGAEGTLWDITGMYASMARTLNRYFTRPGVRRYEAKDFHPPVIHRVDDPAPGVMETKSIVSASSIYVTWEVLKELYRPGEETGWQLFGSAKKIAWKTGTSFGFRDGWAVGVNGDYAVGVWVGNADGEGRPGLTGTEAAAPLLFDLFSLLPSQRWFEVPRSEMTPVAVCARSGYRAQARCEQIDTVLLPLAAERTGTCPFHQKVFVNETGTYRVHADCEPLEKLHPARWFVLPPVQEYYYKSKNIRYQPLPPYRPDCRDPSAIAAMDIIYPRPNASVFVPRLLDGAVSDVVLQATHRNSQAKIYWHLDNEFVGVTSRGHKLALQPREGSHVLVLIDETGQSLQQTFTVIAR